MGKKLRGKKGEKVWYQSFNFIKPNYKVGKGYATKQYQVKLVKRDNVVKNWWYAKFPDGKEYFIADNWKREQPKWTKELPPRIKRKVIVPWKSPVSKRKKSIKTKPKKRKR